MPEFIRRNFNQIESIVLLLFCEVSLPCGDSSHVLVKSVLLELYSISRVLYIYSILEQYNYFIYIILYDTPIPKTQFYIHEQGGRRGVRGKWQACGASLRDAGWQDRCPALPLPCLLLCTAPSFDKEPFCFHSEKVTLMFNFIQH